MNKISELSGVSENIIKKTYDFWVNNFFLENGTPKYYFDKVYPFDIQCASQAIESLVKYSTIDKNAINIAKSTIIIPVN